MSKKIREEIVRISYARHLELVKWAVLIFLIASGVFLSCLYPAAQGPILITAVIICLVVELWNCFYAIGKRRIEVVEKNKMANIILSEADVWEWPILWLVVWPYGYAIGITQGIVATVILSIVAIIVVAATSILLAGIFEKRIIKE